MPKTATQLPSFAELRTFANSSPVARACIEVRKNEIRALGWDIALAPPEGAKFDAGMLADAREDWLRIFSRPDHAYWNFASWLGAALEQTFVADSLTLHHDCSRYGDLISLTLLDGTKIEPVLSPSGRILAYNQHLHDVPRVSIAEMTEPMTCCHGGFTPMDITYAPGWHRDWTVFGRSPIEEALEERQCGPAPGSDERVLEAFGLDGRALGILGGEEIDQARSDAWLTRYTDWLGAVFGSFFGDRLRWVWVNA